MTDEFGTSRARLAIEFSATRRFARLNQRRLATQIRAACAVLGVQSGEVSIRLADDAEMSRLHEEHKGIAGPTDVLTFDFGDPSTIPEPGAARPHLEVEIVVGAQVAQREAAMRNLDPGVEALLYVVHGLLHCLGHDDHNAAQAAVMHRREDQVLRAIGVGPAYRTGSRRAAPSRRL